MVFRRPVGLGLIVAATLVLFSGAPQARDDANMFQIMRENLLRQQQQQRRFQRERAPRAAPSRVVAPQRDTFEAPSTSATFTGAQSRSYCVRTCDGYYFAVGFAKDQNQLDTQRNMCSASCGDAPMRFYVSPVQVTANDGSTAPAIERAVDDTGAPYTALPTAYSFRSGEGGACTCTNTSSGLPQIPFTIDPTLRAGDVVVMPDGLKVFRGQPGGVHSDRDFVSVASSRALPGEVRRQMMTLQERMAP